MTCSGFCAFELDKGEWDCAMPLLACCCLFSPSCKWWWDGYDEIMLIWQWYDEMLTWLIDDMMAIWWWLPGLKPDSFHCWGTFANDNRCNGSLRLCPPDIILFHQMIKMWSLCYDQNMIINLWSIHHHRLPGTVRFFGTCTCGSNSFWQFA